MFKKKSSAEPALAKADALLCIPEKNSLVEENFLESGDLILTYPAMYKPFFMKIRNLVHKNPDRTFRRKLQLDLLGVDVWSRIDGEKNVKEIVKAFARDHRLNYREAEISVTLFLRSLGEKGVIGMKDR